MKHSIKIIGVTLLAFCTLCGASFADPSPIRIGLSTSLTGDTASAGNDILDALKFTNQKFFAGRYEFVVDDDRCDNAVGLTVAKKQVSVDKLKYVLGIFCNTVLLTAAPVYKRAGTVVIAVATTDDVRLGKSSIFRTYPSENHAAELLYDYIAMRHKILGVITELDEYTAMMERTLLQKNVDGKLRIIPMQVTGPGKDYRSVLLRLKSEGVDSLFFNSMAEPGYIEMVKQARALNMTMPQYSNAVPASPTSRKALKDADEGALFTSFPVFESALTTQGKVIYSDYLREKGEPRSNPIFIALAIDSLRLLDEAIHSGEDVSQYISSHAFPGLVGDMGFDKDGAVSTLHYEMQQIKNGVITTGK
jgi:ABC-type branched-subunit amino acid transport system substrate-binding protein